MRREYSTCALIELMQIGQTPSGTAPVLHHAPEAFKRIEVVATMRRQEIQPKRLVPVGERRRERVRPMDATAVGHHDHLWAGVATEGHHVMDVLAQPLRITMGDHLREDFGGPILDRADDAEQHPLTVRLQLRERTHAWRLRDSSLLIWRWLSGRVSNRERWALRYQPARGRAKRQTMVSSS
jgi:hypothetical protein